MAGGLVVGGILGAVVGGVGSAIEARQRRKDAARFRRRFRRGIESGTARTQKQVFDILQSPEFRVAREFTLGTFGVQAPGGAALGSPTSFGGFDFFAPPSGTPISGQDAAIANNLSGQFDKVLTAQRQLRAGVDQNGRPLTDARRSQLEGVADPDRVDNLTRAVSTLDTNQLNAFASGLNQAGVDIGEFNNLRAASLGRQGEPQVSGGVTLDGAGGTQGGAGLIGQTETPLTADFRKRIQQAQSSRGIFSSQAAASAEASGLAAFEFEQRRQSIPQLLQLATFGDTAFQQFEASNINREVQRTTGGFGAFGAANPAAAFGPSPGAAALTGAVSGAFSGAQAGASIQGFQREQGLAQQQQDSVLQELLRGQRNQGVPSNVNFGAAFGRKV